MSRMITVLRSVPKCLSKFEFAEIADQSISIYTQVTYLLSTEDGPHRIYSVGTGRKVSMRLQLRLILIRTEWKRKWN